MPTMVRTSKKAQKIAYAILGKPANMANSKVKRPRRQIVTEALPT